MDLANVAIEFEVEGLPVTMFLVFSQEAGKALLAAGIPRGRILGRPEIAIAKTIPETGDRVAALCAKVMFDGRLQYLDGKLGG